MKILLLNQFNIQKNNSAGITVRRIFNSNEYDVSLQIVIEESKLFLYDGNNAVLCVDNKLSKIGKIIDKLKKYQFDFIYTTGNNIKTLFLIYVLSRMLKKRVLFHFFDNWRETGKAIIKNHILKKINKKREIALVISDEMGEHYKKKYHGEYITLMMGAEYNPVSKDNSDVSVFLYTGGLHLQRDKYLLEFENIIATKKNAKLIIATFKKDFETYGSSFNQDITSFYIDYPHDELKKLYERSDALLFVEPGPSENFPFLRYSMSTKVPEYLSSGLPILCFSKKGLPVTSYFEKTGTAYVASNIDELKESVEKISSCNNKTMLQNAKKHCIEEYSSIAQNKVLDRAIELLLRGDLC